MTFDPNWAVLLPAAGFFCAIGLCYLLRRSGWVWPPRIVMLVLFGAGILFTVEGYRAEDDDWSGIFSILLIFFVIAPAWLGALIGTALGRRTRHKRQGVDANPR